jgi:glycosyltransferase involved in cell wall biosynthesis
LTLALDATYSLGENLSGVGVYSRQILFGLARAHPEARFLFSYRPHRFFRSLRDTLPVNCSRHLLLEARAPRAELFHGLNQRLPRACPRRSVATFHDLFVLTGDYSTPEFKRRFAGQARDAAERSDLVIAVSEFTAGQVRDLLGVSADRVRVIPHGASTRGAHSNEAPPAREKLILHVGAIQRRKNLVRLIEAFERTEPGWRLALAGSFGYGSKEILQRIEGSSRRQDVQVLGYVSQTQLDDLYARAAVFAFPSLDEGFGMPILDAMAAGVPVLTSNRSATAEVSGDAALLVAPEDTGSIAEALHRLTTEEALREELVVRGRRRAALFTWEKAVEATWAAYRDLLC